MIAMDFTTTATSRPDIVERTYSSFNKHLKGIDLKQCRLFINVDPIPRDVKQKFVTKVGLKYFKEVISNYPKKPNYTAAYNWIWSMAESKYIFNLEDDWELTTDVNVEELVSYFDTYPNLYIVPLRAYKYRYLTCPTSPGIMHERYYKAVAGNLNEGLNPEVQLRGNKFGLSMPSKERKISPKGKVIVYPSEIKRVIVRDIGRVWARNQKFKKGGGKKSYFITWETIK